METLTIDPGLPVEIVHEWAVRQSDGIIMRQRMPIHRRKRRRFKLSCDLLSVQEKNHVVDVFTASRGRAGRFLFTPPDEDTAVEFKFASDELPWTADNARRRSMTLEFYEAF